MILGFDGSLMMMMLPVMVMRRECGYVDFCLHFGGNSSFNLQGSELFCGLCQTESTATRICQRKVGLTSSRGVLI